MHLHNVLSDWACDSQVLLNRPCEAGPGWERPAENDFACFNPTVTMTAVTYVCEELLGSVIRQELGTAGI